MASLDHYPENNVNKDVVVLSEQDGTVAVKSIYKWKVHYQLGSFNQLVDKLF